MLTVTARIIDPDGDMAFTFVNLQPACCEDAAVRMSQLDASNRISGTAFDGIYQVSFTIVQNSPNGDWNASARTQDGASHSEEFDSADLISLGLPGTVTNTAAAGDNAAPVLAEFSFTPSVVNTAEAPATITFNARVTDASSGLATGFIGVFVETTDGGFMFWGVGCFTAPNRTAGDQFDGTYQCTFQVPENLFGIYTIFPIDLEDVVLNKHRYDEEELDGLGFPFQFVNGDCGDGELDAGEECDDGNATTDDGCQVDCTATGAVCGDGFVHATELCDDENVTDNDGCDGNCRPTGCGNFARTLGEECDDGNLEDDDGCEADCTLSAGVLDSSYGTDGVSYGTEKHGGERMFLDLQSDGSAVVAYNTYDGDPSHGRLAVSRYLPDGGLDASFGTAGIAFTSLPAKDLYAGGVAVQSDGRIVAAGWHFTMGTPGFVLERLLANGNLDASFGSSGIAAPPSGGDAFIHEVVIDPDGRILLTGGIADETLFLARYNANGTIDSTFGTGGFVSDVHLSTANTAVVQPDGRIVTLSFGYDSGSGVEWRRVVVSRYLENGQLDTSFGDDGRTILTNVRPQNPPGALALLADGKVVVGVDATTSSAAGIVAIRLNSDGSLDSTFHGDGISAVIDVDSRIGEHVSGIVVGGDGKITLSGSRSYREVVVARFLPDGTADSGFVGKGWVSFGSAGYDTVAHDIAMDAQGRIVIAAEWDPPAAPAGVALLRVIAGSCGDLRAQLADGEQCDDGNAVDGDGCESDCRLTPISQPVSAGGTVSTGAEATPSAPVQTAVTSPSSGTVSIAPPGEPAPVGGYKVLGLQLQIEAPAATADDPLVLVFTLDASLLPPGADPLSLEVLRNGVAIADCTGTSGVATPDPCIDDRVELPDGDVQITVLTSHASLWTMALRGLGASGQRCVNEVGKRAAGVAKAQGKINADCLKAESSGSGMDAEACLLLDPNGKVASAGGKVDAAAGAFCDPLPPFGVSSAPVASAASEAATRSLASDLLGSDIDAAAALANSGKCQASALKAMQKLFGSFAKLSLACAKSGLTGDPEPMTSANELGSCLESLQLHAKAVKAVGTLKKKVASACGGDPSVNLPGSCAGEDEVGGCLADRARCRLCQAFEATWGAEIDCDSVDNGFVEGSCE
ncbi:MAG: hypothetical protein ABR587_02630 [Candidatus Binatia bacterium]